VARSDGLVGTPETKTIAREHLAACLACVLRNLPERKAAALLLKEVHGFTLAEMADILEATEGQAKGWLKDARAHMRDRYREACSLIAKQRLRYQSVELDGYFPAGQGSPIAVDGDRVAARIEVLKELRTKRWGAWHTMLLSLLDDLQ
jgi:RNA polymerase sigma-70 factor (ECF subfamily)